MCRSENFFEANFTEIDVKLVRDLSFISQLAHYKDGMEIQSVEPVAAGKFKMNFEYDWHIFHGCMGVNETGVMKDRVFMTMADDGTIELDLAAFDARSTADDL